MTRKHVPFTNYVNAPIVAAFFVAAILIAMLLSACSSPLAVTDNETGLLRDSGFSQLGGQNWKTETTWRQYIHANGRLYQCDINLGGSEFRKYAASIYRARDGEGLHEVASTHGSKDGFWDLYEAVDWIHRQIDGDRGKP